MKLRDAFAALPQEVLRKPIGKQVFKALQKAAKKEAYKRKESK